MVLSVGSPADKLRPHTAFFAVLNVPASVSRMPRNALAVQVAIFIHVARSISAKAEAAAPESCEGHKSTRLTTTTVEKPMVVS